MTGCWELRPLLVAVVSTTPDGTLLKYLRASDLNDAVFVVGGDAFFTLADSPPDLRLRDYPT